MPYSQFTTVGKAKEAFNLTVVEVIGLMPQVNLIQASDMLTSFLVEALPLAAVGSDKARSELIISPVLVEVRRILNHQISLFSGAEFNVDDALGLNGACDFLISGSPKLLEIEAPVLMVIEAKNVDTMLSIGQCVAKMVAAQRFNQAKQQPVTTIYGCVSSGKQWRFLQLEGSTVTIDLLDYFITEVKLILGVLVSIVQDKPLQPQAS